jgi:hypothetical protein
MWLLGMLVGMAGGALAGGLGGVPVGGLVGVLAGAALSGWGRRAAADSNARLREQVGVLQAKVDWLYREFERQKQELALLRGATPTGDGAVAPATDSLGAIVKSGVWRVLMA